MNESCRFEAYAMLSRHSHDTALAAQLHREQHVQHAQRHLHHFVRDLIAEAAQAGRIRSDIDADELTHYCLHALVVDRAPPATL
jgi:hypothetical protein